ncbi:AraC family transcriptional regulator [Erythrobacter oryzae]|uniref:AraC family transcriptional regulator n=1 Tax=Erythrobacter oryzae TaxID=3019556 RepID=UPI0025568013|nr:AraC family transcriptional regulator [Erythrobacter sp. COR-2]
MTSLADFDEWMQTGRLSQYVLARKSAGQAISLYEAAQPAGDMSDPPNSSLVLVQLLSNGVKQISNFGGGRRDAAPGIGKYILVPPAFATEFEVFVPHRIRVVGFAAERYRPLLEAARPGGDPFDFGRLHAAPFIAPRLAELLDAMWADAADQGGGRLLAETLALKVLTQLAAAADGAAAQARGGLAPWAERRVRDYLEDNLMHDTSLAELAALVGLSPFHFNRMFKQSTGVSPYSYLRHVRVGRARALLASGDLPVIEIALAVGYGTPQAFARMFRAETGMSPTRWRRMHRGSSAL